MLIILGILSNPIFNLDSGLKLQNRVRPVREDNRLKFSPVPDTDWVKQVMILKVNLFVVE